MAGVDLVDICKSYDASNDLAVRDVNIHVDDGEFMVLLGPSGCGKSTTLRMIAGLESITSGSLSIDDERMNGVPARDRDIAMVFQSYALYPHMSVRDNLGFGLKRRQADRAVVRRRVDEVAASIGLTDYRLMASHGYYSVISPEGAAAIEGRIGEGNKVPRELVEVCADRLRLTAMDNFNHGLIDRIIKEPPLGARRDDFAFFAKLRLE